MRNMLLAALAASALSLNALAADKPDKTPPPAAPVSPMTAAGLSQGVVLISADSFNQVMTVMKAMTDLAPEFATPAVQKAFTAMRGCAQDNLQAPAAGQDSCPAVTAALSALTAKADAPAPAKK